MKRARIKWMLILITYIVICLLPLEAMAGKKIGVLMFSEEARYHESLKGIKKQIENEGFKEPEVMYTVENADGSKVKAAELVKKFSTMKYDLIITLGTSATVAIAKEIKDVPIVFSMVFDPVEAKIAKSLESSGNNTTGASARVPMDMLVKTMKDFAPVKKLAVLYTPGQKNSESQLLALKDIEVTSQVKIIPVILSKTEEVDRVLSGLIQSVDAIYLTGSSIVGTEVQTIVDRANKAKVITITHLDDLMDKGVLMAVSPNSYRLGLLAGGKAVKIFKGTKPSSIPIECDSKLDIIINKKTAKAGQFTIPPAFLKKVTRTIE